MHTATTICLYALLFFLLAVTGCYFVSKFIKHRESAKAVANTADIEANKTVDDKKHSPIGLPDNFYLDPIVYPTARRSPKRDFFRRALSDRLPLGSSVINPPLPAATLTHDGKGSNNGQPPSISSVPALAPYHPPRPTRLDDLLLGFPYEARATKDFWYPLANEETGRWELGVARGSINNAQLLKDVDYHLVKGMAWNYAGTVEDTVVNVPSSPPLNAQGEYPPVDTPPQRTKKHRKNGKSSKRWEDKTRNVYPHGFEIPELHVNARPYAEIEADEEARAAAAMIPTTSNDA